MDFDLHAEYIPPVNFCIPVIHNVNMVSYWQKTKSMEISMVMFSY